AAVGVPRRAPQDRDRAGREVQAPRGAFAGKAASRLTHGRRERGAFPYLPDKEASMVKATITSKGQDTIPKRVRDDLGLVTADHVGFVAAGSGSYKLKPIRTRSSAQGVCDRLVKPRAHASVEGMERAGEDSVPRRFVRAVR